MKILVLTNMFPSERNKIFGPYIKRQVESLGQTGVEVITVARTRKTNLAYVPFILKSIFYLLFTSYDLVHAHYGFHSALFAAVIKIKPLVITFHRGDALSEPFRNKVYFKLQRFVVSRADYFIAVSNEIKNALIKYLGARSNNISVITCEVDTNLFLPVHNKKKRKELGISDNSKVILFVGTLEYRKGIDLLLECAKRIEEVDFIFIGEGEVKGNCKNCRFIGWQPNYSLPEWFNIADVFVLPSRSEGTPVVLLEALSCGIPVVASKVGGIPDLVRDGETGYLVEPEDVDMLEKRLRGLLENSRKRKRMGQQGREDMIENYDSRKIADRIKQVYEKVLSENQ